MNEIIFEVVKIFVMAAVLVITRYLVPWIKQKICAEKLAEIENWAKQVVFMVQQVYKEWAGENKKIYVTKFLKELLMSNNISISDEQLDILIEAAVKQMKIQENRSLVNVSISDTPTSE